jgi:hypothetical protein
MAAMSSSYPTRRRLIIVPPLVGKQKEGAWLNGHHSEFLAQQLSHRRFGHSFGEASEFVADLTDLFIDLLDSPGRLFLKPSTSQGCFLTEDPIGFVGGLNLNESVRSAGESDGRRVEPRLEIRIPPPYNARDSIPNPPDFDGAQPACSVWISKN